MRLQERIRIIAAVMTAVFVVTPLAARWESSRANADPATPCAQTLPTATPPANGACPSVAPQVEPGTPAAADGLTVTLAISSGRAGLVTLTVGVTDEHGAPVDDVTVAVKARHLDMDMGEFPHDALQTAPGTYTAERVGMGMGGNWQVEVDVARPGHDPVALFFRVTMEGLR